MEPGTFKDRYLLEGNPHQLIAGMIIAAYAIQAQKAYIFIRWAYKKAEIDCVKQFLKHIRQVILERIYWEQDITSIFIFIAAPGGISAVRRQALINSLEGKRGIPRAKPPFPATSGLFGQPTVVNNVETLCWIPSYR